MDTRMFRIPRQWSNMELKKISPFFKGDIINVSGWRDEDKEGGHYSDYFLNKTSYTITNFKSEMRGFQGMDNEVFLDLAADLPVSMINGYDVVFNHTVLEHIYEVHKAFANLCLMAREAVIIVVPFLQPMHSNYGDYWRFSPMAIKRMFEDNGLSLQYLTFNNNNFASVYIFAIGLKPNSVYHNLIPFKYSEVDSRKIKSSENFVGVSSIQNLSLTSILRFIFSR